MGWRTTAGGCHAESQRSSLGRRLVQAGASGAPGVMALGVSLGALKSALRGFVFESHAWEERPPPRPRRRAVAATARSEATRGVFEPPCHHGLPRPRRRRRASQKRQDSSSKEKQRRAGAQAKKRAAELVGGEKRGDEWWCWGCWGLRS